MAQKGIKTQDDKKKPSLSYFSKEKCACPVCRKDFPKEIMLSGNGRMIAGGLSDELHRTFEPSKKFGRIYPLIYEIGACPNCYTALFWNDFKALQDQDALDNLLSKSEERKKNTETVFPYFDLGKQRTLYDGVAIYYLALQTYDKVTPDMIPTLKSAIISLRLAWLCNDLEERAPGHNFNYMAQVFYRKSAFYYQQAIIAETERTEKSSSLGNSGPDMDKNYGWDGVVYLCGLLEYKYGQTKDPQMRLKKLSESKTAIARLFGLGKSSKSKPGPLLEKARDLYNTLTKELKDEEDF